MIKILFVCHGNICRSTMAEFIMKEIVRKAAKEVEYEITSCATTNDEIGNDIYPLAKKVLDKHNIPYERHFARRFKCEDYDNNDYIIVMDDENLYDLRYMVRDNDKKIHKLMEYLNETRDVSDPWYTRDFDKAYDDIYKGCCKLFMFLEKEVD